MQGFQIIVCMMTDTAFLAVALKGDLSSQTISIAEWLGLHEINGPCISPV